MQPRCHLSGFPRAAGRGRGRNDTGRRVGGQGEGGTLQAVFPVVKGPCPKSPFPCRSASCSTRSPSCRSSPSRSEEHTSELQSLMRISYAVFCLKKKNKLHNDINTY